MGRLENFALPFLFLLPCCMMACAPADAARALKENLVNPNGPTLSLQAFRNTAADNASLSPAAAAAAAAGGDQNNGSATEAAVESEPPINPVSEPAAGCEESPADNVGDVETADEQTGDEQTGDEQTGDEQTGDEQTGDEQTGDEQTGDEQTGDEQTGDEQTGDEQTGDEQTGDEQTGDEQTGDEQTGDEQTGDEQTGDEQTGDEQTGDEQTGDEQTGDEQTGDEQTGDEQTGDEQTGDEQTGDEQTGDEQTGDEQTGDEQTGDEQTGDEQTGDEQTGDEQTGDEQTGDEQTGDEPDSADSSAPVPNDHGPYLLGSDLKPAEGSEEEVPAGDEHGPLPVVHVPQPEDADEEEASGSQGAPPKPDGADINPPPVSNAWLRSGDEMAQMANDHGPDLMTTDPVPSAEDDSSFPPAEISSIFPAAATAAVGDQGGGSSVEAAVASEASIDPAFEAAVGHEEIPAGYGDDEQTVDKQAGDEPIGTEFGAPPVPSAWLRSIDQLAPMLNDHGPYLVGSDFMPAVGSEEAPAGDAHGPLSVVHVPQPEEEEPGEAPTESQGAPSKPDGVDAGVPFPNDHGPYLLGSDPMPAVGSEEAPTSDEHGPLPVVYVALPEAPGGENPAGSQDAPPRN
ncbi:hypothetical protein CLOM_g15163 [Closterium sp. NIES-68]|nr:hypothetical protein CLOM_g15163 [Closterium sp. NIES-68]GJP73048.1 hypothetical protein CLOP_g3802 [Closterium sp. NIES-67]